MPSKITISPYPDEPVEDSCRRECYTIKYDGRTIGSIQTDGSWKDIHIDPELRRHAPSNSDELVLKYLSTDSTSLHLEAVIEQIFQAEKSIAAALENAGKETASQKRSITVYADSMEHYDTLERMRRVILIGNTPDGTKARLEISTDQQFDRNKLDPAQHGLLREFEKLAPESRLVKPLDEIVEDMKRTNYIQHRAEESDLRTQEFQIPTFGTMISCCFDRTHAMNIYTPAMKEGHFLSILMRDQVEIDQGKAKPGLEKKPAATKKSIKSAGR